MAVPNADDDSERIVGLLRKHGNKFQKVIVTLDSHSKIHIAHGIFWTSPTGETPAPFSAIKAADIETGRWIPKDESLIVSSLKTEN